MIARFPLPECPVCQYSFQGHPGGGRCPECGFEWDDATLVFRPARPWKTSIRLLFVELLLFWLFIRPISTVLEVTFGRLMAGMVIILLIGAILVGTVVYVWRANRRGRFAALTPNGLVVQNLNLLVELPYEEIVFVATDDSVPWVQQRGGAPVSLRGLFDNKRERELFKEAASAAVAEGYAALRQPEKPAAEPTDLAEVHGRSPDTARNSEAAPGPRSVSLTRIGVTMLALALLGLFLCGFLWKRAIGAAILLFWLGAAVALVGQWRGDTYAGKTGR